MDNAFRTPNHLVESLPSRRAWIRGFLNDRCMLADAEYGLDLLVSEVIPYVNSEEGMAAQSLLVAFLYTYDRVDMSSTPGSLVVNLEEAVDALKGVLRGRRCQNPAYDWYGAELLEALCSYLGDDADFALFSGEMERFLDVTLIERENRLHHNVPRIEQYFECLRDYSCGVGPCVLTAVMFHPRRRTLIEGSWSSEPARQMLTLCKRIISIHNDVFGLDREKEAGDVNNFVISLSEEVNEKTAIKIACSIANGMYASFFDMKSSAEQSGLSVLWEACNCWIVGNWIWSTSNTHRFSEPPGVIGD